MLRKLLRKAAMRLSLIIFLLITGKVTMAAESATANEPVKINQNTLMEEYQQELSRLDAISRAPGGDLAEMEKMAQEVQDHWSQRDEQQYSALMWAICGILIGHDFGLSNMAKQENLARKYATLALQQNEQMPVRTEIGLLLCMPGQTEYSKSQMPKEIWIKQRGEETELWLHALQRLNNEIDPNFDVNKRYPQYIKPPAGYENFPFPVPPEVIKDPQTRAKYEADIATNMQNAENYAEQYALRNLERNFSPFLEKYLVNAYSKLPYNMEELMQDLNLYVKDDGSKNKIITEVNEAIQRNAQKEKGNNSPNVTVQMDGR